MAWSSLSLPPGYSAISQAFVNNGRGLQPATGGAWLLTDDFESWRIAPAPENFEARGMAFDGTRWIVVGVNFSFQPRIARSLDGATGLEWEVFAPSAPPAALWEVLAAAGGRLVNIGSTQIATSDDGGDTWTPRATLPATTPRRRLTRHASGVITAVGFGEWMAWSLDNGETWSQALPVSSRNVSALAYAGTSGWAVSLSGDNNIPYSTSTPPSTFNATNTANGTVQHNIVALGTTFYDFVRIGGQVRVRALDGPFTDSVVMDELDTAGVVFDTNEWDFWATNGSLVLYSLQQTKLYSLVVASVEDGIALPLRLSVEAIAPLALPLRLAVQASPAVPLPLRLSVGTAGAALPLPLRLAVLDEAVFGGLDGAGGWAAAPDGQWQAVVVLGDDDISAHVGPVSVQIAADAARTAQFAFRPVAPLQPLALIGRRVRIAFAQAGGQNAQTVFQGVVDVPSVDLQTGLITCTCTDQAQEVWSNTARDAIDAIVGGRWHVAVSGEPEDNYEYMRERIASVPASWALDVQQRPRVLPWRSPARSVIVRTADVIEGSLSVDLHSREQLRSRITCRLQYRYPVLRWRVAQAQYSQPVQFFLPTVGVSGSQPSKLWLTRGMVEAATERMSGWEMISRNIESPPARSWVLGSSGAVYAIRADVAPTLATGFQARYRTRWRQTITEGYTVTVKWPWLESQLPAPVGDEAGATLDAPFDVIGWDSDSSVQPQFNLEFPGDHATPWQPAGYTSADRDAALATLLDRAWVRLWGASRSGRVNFALPCRPDMWLDWRITLEHAAMRAQGDVVEIEHVLDNQTGAAITSVSLAVGLPGNTPATTPAWPALGVPSPVPAPASEAYSFEIGTYVGGAAGVAPFDETEMIGFCTNYERSDPGLEYYPHQLSIRAPALSSADRDPATAALTAEIAVDVPTDLLEITA